MTYAITMVKCATGNRERVLKILLGLKEAQKPQKGSVTIEECYISFGWPDFVLIFKGDNIELIKAEIVSIRAKIFKNKGGNLETSTIICTTKKDMDKMVTDSIKNI